MGVPLGTMSAWMNGTLPSPENRVRFISFTKNLLGESPGDLKTAVERKDPTTSDELARAAARAVAAALAVSSGLRQDVKAIREDVRAIRDSIQALGHPFSRTTASLTVQRPAAKDAASSEAADQFDWLTVREAARMVRCHEETIRRAYRSGHLRAERVGRSVRIDRQALTEWRANGCKTT